MTKFRIVLLPTPDDRDQNIFWTAVAECSCGIKLLGAHGRTAVDATNQVFDALSEEGALDCVCGNRGGRPSYTPFGMGELSNGATAVVEQLQALLKAQPEDDMVAQALGHAVDIAQRVIQLSAYREMILLAAASPAQS